MKEENRENYCTMYFVRHGETQWNVSDIIQGQSDSPLTELGLKQAEDTKNKLKNINFDIIYSSDSLRAFYTAQIIKGERNIEIIKSPALRERFFGRFEGLLSSEFTKALGSIIEEKHNQPDEQQYSFKISPDVESDKEIMNRFIPEIKGIALDNIGKQVLVVTHGGCIRNFLAITGYAKIKDLPPRSFKNAGHVKVISDGTDFAIEEVEGLKKL